MITAEDFRRLALSFSGAEESSHMDSTDFRIGGRIFATLASMKEGYGNIKLTPALQADFIAEAPQLSVPIAGGWGRMEMTHIRFAVADEATLTDALRAAWKLRCKKNGAQSKKTVRSPQ